VVIAVLVAGCEIPSLPAESTELVQLQILSVVVDPPLVRPGDVPSATAWITDPKDEGYELLMWTCTDLGEGCLEILVDLELWTYTPVVSQGQSAAWLPDLNTNELPADVEVPISVFALACAPGLCPEIQQVRDRDPAVAPILADPLTFAQSLPIEGTSLVRRGIEITGDIDAKNNDNPNVQTLPPPDVLVGIDRGDVVSLDFVVSDETDMTSDGYATGGSMSDGSWTSHNLHFTWTAPNDPGDYEVWVLIEDGTGGSAVWRGMSHIE
jgi:hypothetical protein